MIRRQTWIILGLFVALLAGTMFWQQTRLRNAAEETPVIATPLPEENLFDPAGAPISYIMLQRVEDGVMLEMRKQAGVWALLQPKAELTDSSQIESAVTSLISARIIAKPSGATDLAVLGLQPSMVRMVVGLESGKQITINIGKAAGAGTGYYVLTDARVVFIVNKFGLDTLLQMLDNPPALPTPTPTFTPELTLDATGVLTGTQTITQTVTPAP